MSFTSSAAIHGSAAACKVAVRCAVFGTAVDLWTAGDTVDLCWHLGANKSIMKHHLPSGFQASQIGELYQENVLEAI